MKIFVINDVKMYICRFHNVVKVVNTSGEQAAQFQKTIHHRSVPCPLSAPQLCYSSQGVALKVLNSSPTQHFKRQESLNSSGAMLQGYVIQHYRPNVCVCTVSMRTKKSLQHSCLPFNTSEDIQNIFGSNYKKMFWSHRERNIQKNTTLLLL